MTRSALVAGAGIAGLATACVLARDGWQVEICEQAPALGEVGAGLQMSPNAMQVLRALGVEDAVLAAGFEPEAALLRDGRTGRRHLDLPLKPICRGRYGAPYVHIHRADLHAILVDAARAAGVEIRLGSPITGFTDTGAGIEVSADGTARTADLLIGADGVRSAVRAAMLGPEAPRFTGQVAWRGVVPAERLPPGTVAPAATVWAGPGRHLVTYYLRGGSLVNIVAVEERDDWREEGWTTPGDPARLRAAFAGWHPAVRTVLEHVEETFLWALFGRPALPRWHDTRAVLVGDACHPTLPFMAQGAAMALEDAVVLARHLAATDDLPAALARYQAARRPRATRLQSQARANAGLFHLNAGPGGVFARAKLAVTPYLPRLVALHAFDWIYGYDATTA